MKLKYKTPPDSQGGSAIAGCGTIHISEVRDTLTKLSDELELPFDLNDYVLGSTGKKEYSGDIDLVIDKKWWNNSPGDFRLNLIDLYGVDNTARNGAMIHLKYPIVNYKEDLLESKPRTGFVQIDFNFGHADWERFYHYSPGDKSEYKGAHRNLAIAAICSINVENITANTDHLCRCTSVVRWKFGSNGFIKVNRNSVTDVDGNWMKKQLDYVLEGPITDPSMIVILLFNDDRATVADLFSLETIIESVKRYCGLVEQERIWRQMAHNFSDWKDGINFIYPPEIAAYISLNDK
jgi:hypothetical protein